MAAARGQGAAKVLAGRAWRLRRLLATEKHEGAAAIIPTSRDLLLEITDHSIVDAHRFASMVTDAFRSGDIVQNLAELDRAVELYTGAFLDGDEDEWILVQRERLHCLYVRALTAMMHALSNREKYEDALGCGSRT